MSAPEISDSFAATFGTGRGRPGRGLGAELPPAARLAHIRSALAHGELRPGFAWMTESPYPARERDYERARGLAYAETTATLLTLVGETELAHARWVLRTVGAAQLLSNPNIIPELVRRAQTNNSVILTRQLQQGLAGDIMTLRELVRGYMQNLLCEYLAGRVNAGGIASVRQVLGSQRQRELAKDVRACTRERTMARMLQCSALSRQSWQAALAHYHDHQEIRELPSKRAQTQLRDLLLATGYAATNVRRRYR